MVVIDERDLREIIRTECQRAVADALKLRDSREVVKGMQNLAKRLGVSKSTINNWKSEGLLENCYEQRKRTIIFDVQKVINAKQNKRHENKEK